MNYKTGTLQMLPSGRWGIVHAGGEEPIEITSGDCFWLEQPGSGAMELTRMESGYSQKEGRAMYYSVDNFELRAGLRAAFEGRSFRL